MQNYPNPFNPGTNFGFRIASGSGSGLVELKIYDLLGNEIAVVVNDMLPAGSYNYSWDASGISSGVYFYRLTAGNFTETKKLVVMK